MDWKRLSTTIITKVYNRLFFSSCYICNAKSQSSICNYCISGLEKNTSHCSVCKIPTNPSTDLCGSCQKNQPPYSHCYAPFLFDGIIKSLIHNIKFHQKSHYIQPLMKLVGDSLIKEYQDKSWPEQLLYIPSHPNRIRERGFCHTQIMAKKLASYLKEVTDTKNLLTTVKNPIQKRLHTQAQHTLNRKERLKQPNNIYQIQGNIAKHVALFDDVMTTGSTIEQCTQQLLKAGAEQVDIWVIARTPNKIQ